MFPESVLLGPLLNKHFDFFLSAVEFKGKTDCKVVWDGELLTWRCAVPINTGANLHIIRVVAVNVKLLQKPSTLPLLTVFSGEARYAITCKAHSKIFAIYLRKILSDTAVGIPNI